MGTKGQRVKRTRWIQAGSLVVRVEVDAVIPEEDPSEPCFEPQTVELLRQVHERAQAGDVEWLKRIGQVYQRIPA